MPTLLGIDLGTSSVKAVLFDADTSQTLAVAGEEYPIFKPQPDAAEQNPDDWWQATIHVVRQVVSASGRRDVAAIGLDGQMHGATLVDADGDPVRPSIIWADQRSANMVTELIEMIGAGRHAQLCGTLPAAGFTAPTLMWLAAHEPETLKRAQHLIFPKDYLRLQMVGEIGSDYSDAAGSGMFDVAQHEWAREIIERAKLPERIFPPVVESTSIAGTLRPAAADMLGLPAGIPVVTGSCDQPAHAVANGLIAPGLASIAVGSGGQVVVPMRPTPGSVLPTDPRLHVFNHAVPGMYYVLGAILSAGLSLRWLRDLFGMTADPQAYPTFSRESAAVAAGADGLLFLPYLTGERTPHMDANARGAFVGLSAHHGRGHLARAVMEGVAFALRQALEISLSLSGQVERIVGAGGAMESDVWRGILTDTIGLPLQRPLLKEQAGTGAALIAGVATGIYGSFEDVRERVVRYSEPTLPDPERRAFYDERYAQFISLYQTLREDFHRLAAKPEA